MKLFRGKGIQLLIESGRRWQCVRAGGHLLHLLAPSSVGPRGIRVERCDAAVSVELRAGLVVWRVQSVSTLMSQLELDWVLCGGQSCRVRGR